MMEFPIFSLPTVASPCFSDKAVHPLRLPSAQPHKLELSQLAPLPAPLSQISTGMASPICSNPKMAAICSTLVKETEPLRPLICTPSEKPSQELPLGTLMA